MIEKGAPQVDIAFDNFTKCFNITLSHTEIK